MKKSQILAALALAFALGVVAPVATATDTYAFTAPSEHHAQGTATPDDVDVVVAAVPTEYPLMGRMVTLKSLSDAYTAGAHNDLATDTIASGQTVSKDARNIVVALNTLNGSAINATAVWGETSYTAQISAAAAEANKIADYDTVSAIFSATTDGELQNALRAFNTEFHASVKADSDVTLASYATADIDPNTAGTQTVEDQVVAAIVAEHGAGSSLTYANYKAVYNAIVAAQDNANKYTAQFNAFRNALTADGVMTSEGWAAYNGYMKNNANPTILSLFRITNDCVPTTGSAAASDYVNDMAGRTQLANILDRVVKTPYDDNINYRTIIAITTQLKKVAKITDRTEIEIAQDLLKYEGPKADVPTVKPGDVNGEDDNKLPTVGNTGTIAGADATAKATVSIMAAIASVATAAFVAIRKIAAGKKA